MAMSEIAAKVFYTKGSKGIFRALVVQIDDDSSQIEDDIFNPLHEPKLIIPGQE